MQYILIRESVNSENKSNEISMSGSHTNSEYKKYNFVRTSHFKNKFLKHETYIGEHFICIY